jgi:hypothetical protein
VAQAGWVVLIVEITDTVPAVRVEVVEAVVRTDPHAAVRLDPDGLDEVVTETVGIVRVVGVVGEDAGGRVKLVQSAAVSADPEHAGGVLSDLAQDVETQAIGVVRIVAIVGELFG